MILSRWPKKPSFCNLCSKVFTNSESLSVYVKRQESKDPVITITEANVKSELCAVCHETFTNLCLNTFTDMKLFSYSQGTTWTSKTVLNQMIWSWKVKQRRSQIFGTLTLLLKPPTVNFLSVMIVRKAFNSKEDLTFHLKTHKIIVTVETTKARMDNSPINSELTPETVYKTNLPPVQNVW